MRFMLISKTYQHLTKLLKGLINMNLSNTRANQRLARALFATFNGAISLQVAPINTQRMTFQANVTFETGNVGTPSVTFTPCDDAGRVRIFGDIDDLIKWVNGAFNDVTSIDVVVEEAEKLAKPFVPPTDTLADAQRKKTQFEALKAKGTLSLAAATAKVNAEIAAGNNAPEAHPALQAIYQEFVKQQTAVQAQVDYYDDRITHYTAIITAAAGG